MYCCALVAVDLVRWSMVGPEHTHNTAYTIQVFQGPIILFHKWQRLMNAVEQCANQKILNKYKWNDMCTISWTVFHLALHCTRSQCVQRKHRKQLIKLINDFNWIFAFAEMWKPIINIANAISIQLIASKFPCNFQFDWFFFSYFQFWTFLFVSLDLKWSTFGLWEQKHNFPLEFVMRCSIPNLCRTHRRKVHVEWRRRRCYSRENWEIKFEKCQLVLEMHWINFHSDGSHFMLMSRWLHERPKDNWKILITSISVTLLGLNTKWTQTRTRQDQFSNASNKIDYVKSFRHSSSSSLGHIVQGTRSKEA